MRTGAPTKRCSVNRVDASSSPARSTGSPRCAGSPETSPRGHRNRRWRYCGGAGGRRACQPRSRGGAQRLRSHADRGGRMSDFWDDDSPHDECGVVGIVAPGRDVSRLAFFAPPRAPASWPGERRHRGHRRRARHGAAGSRPGRHGVRRAVAAQPVGSFGHRARALLDDRFEQVGERAAGHPQPRRGPGRARPQRQPDQHRRAARADRQRSPAAAGDDRLRTDRRAVGARARRAAGCGRGGRSDASSARSRPSRSRRTSWSPSATRTACARW